MENMWDQRFSDEEFAYGQKPNEFVKSVIDLLEPGKMLIPGEGEGRHAVYAAQNGWDVLAFDTSKVGREKALDFAKKKNVSIRYELDDYQGFHSDEKFDAIVLVFTHMPSAMRQEVHQKYAGMLKDGGRMIMQFFSKEQLGHSTGGPQNTDLLLSIEELEDDFSGLTSFSAEKDFKELDEGPFHQGKAHVISATGIR